jgi:hypothetical protein
MSCDLPIACSLSDGEQSRRLAEIGAVGRDALRGIDRNGELRFRSDPSTRQRLQAVIAAESECCPFLTFELRDQAGELILAIAGPDEAGPLVRELIDAFAAA